MNSNFTNEVQILKKKTNLTSLAVTTEPTHVTHIQPDSMAILVTVTSVGPWNYRQGWLMCNSFSYPVRLIGTNSKYMEQSA